jgi:hypothetical protein
VREIAQVLQVSQAYAAHVSAGKRVPHPRPWLALAKLAGLLLYQSLNLTFVCEEFVQNTQGYVSCEQDGKLYAPGRRVPCKRGSSV